jgi:DNA-binding transcriptional MerR regulator
VHIGDLARSAGTTARALRYYEEQGLLTPERDANGYRRYGPDDVAVVHRIRALLAAGLGSDGARRFLDCARGVDGDVREAGEVSFELCPELQAELDRLRSDLISQERSLAARRALIDRHLAAAPVRVASTW